MADEQQHVMEDDSKHKSIWNNSMEYFQLMSAIEREVVNAYINKNYLLLNDYMETYWFMLSEWFTLDEEKVHDELRAEQQKANKLVLAAIHAGKKTISTETAEVYLKRWRALTRTYHIHGLRAITMDRQDDMGLLGRKAKVNYHRY